MSNKKLESWQHQHTFAQDQKKPGEIRTIIVIIITALMMVVEIIAGIIYGSMALLADGLHMASHTVALGISVFAYIFARRNAQNLEFSFGTGKVNALGGFTGAILLAIFAICMAIESFARLINPQEIIYNQAIIVAIIGLMINGVCVYILGFDEHPQERHEGHYEHSNHYDSTEYTTHHQHDHNLKSAYLHILADALTSVLAIIALLSAKYFGLIWMDAMMGIFGAVLVARWSYGLLISTSDVLLDRQGSQNIQAQIRNAIEQDGDSKITDLHVWKITPNGYSSEIVIVAQKPATVNEYKARIPKDLGLLHIVMELHSY